MNTHTPLVQSTLSKMNHEQKLTFESEFNRQKLSKGFMIFLSIFFPIQLFFLGKTGLGVAFLLSGGGMFVWWIIEIFLTPKRVGEYNNQIAVNIARDLKIME